MAASKSAVSILILAVTLCLVNGLKGPREKAMRATVETKEISNSKAKVPAEMRFKAMQPGIPAPGIYSGAGARGILDQGVPFYGHYSRGYGPMAGAFGGGFGGFYNQPTPYNSGLPPMPSLAYNGYGPAGNSFPYAGPYVNLEAVNMRLPGSKKAGAKGESKIPDNYGPNPYSFDLPTMKSFKMSQFGPRAFGPYGVQNPYGSPAPYPYGAGQLPAAYPGFPNIYQFGARFGAPKKAGGESESEGEANANGPTTVPLPYLGTTMIPKQYPGGVPAWGFARGFQGLPPAYGVGNIPPFAQPAGPGRYQVPYGTHAWGAVAYPNPNLDRYSTVTGIIPPPASGGEAK